MKNKIIFILFVIGIFCVNGLFAQQQAFDFNAIEKEKNIFEISFQFFEDIGVKFIQIDLLEEGSVIERQEAILNKKEDSNYYLFYRNQEKLIYLDDLKIEIEKKWGKSQPKSLSLAIRILNENFEILSADQKQIR